MGAVSQDGKQGLDDRKLNQAVAVGISNTDGNSDKLRSGCLLGILKRELHFMFRVGLIQALLLE